MVKQIDYWDVNKDVYISTSYERDRANDELKNVKVINVETLKSVIRFWYYKED